MILYVGSSAESRDRVAAFHRGLKELGFIEGRDVAIEYRWAMGLPKSEAVSARVGWPIYRQEMVPALVATSAIAHLPQFARGQPPISLGGGFEKMPYEGVDPAADVVRINADHPFGVLDRRRAVGIIEPPPSWIRIEPCAMPRSLPFGGFWKKFGVCVSPPERFEEWVGVASHSFISYRTVGLVAIGLVDRPGTPPIGRRRPSGHSSAG